MKPKCACGKLIVHGYANNLFVIYLAKHECDCNYCRTHIFKECGHSCGMPMIDRCCICKAYGEKAMIYVWWKEPKPRITNLDLCAICKERLRGEEG